MSAMLPFEAEARAAIGDELFGYLLGRAVDGGDEDANEAALRQFRLVPRIMADVQAVDLNTRILGLEAAAPLIVGAFAGDRLFHPEGLLAVARACHRLRLPLIVSEETVTPLAEIAVIHDQVLLQLRAAGPVARVMALADHAAKVGARGLVLTVLAPAHPIDGLRPGGFNVSQELRDRGWTTIGSDRPGPMPLPAFPNWTTAEVSQIAAHSKALGLALIVKGVLHPDDVARCEQAGADAVMVSNIGLRQSSRWIASAHALAAVRTGSSTKTPLLFDGGVRHGSDVLIACLLGAQAAVVSRPILSALAGRGEQGVEATLRSLIDATMAMTLWMGAGRIDALTQDQLVTADGRPVVGGEHHG